VEHAIDTFAQWLLGVITESRLDVLEATYLPGTTDVVARLNGAQYMRTQQPLIFANSILKSILCDDGAQFAWTGRRNARKVAVISGGRALASGLDSLSGANRHY
jgi:hypothetical protein